MTREPDWIAEAPRRGWLSRLLAPQTDARPATSAFLVAVLAAAAFLASVTTKWQQVVIPPPENNSEDQPQLIWNYHATTTDLLGLVYVLGVIALLVGAGAVTNRPDLALRLRIGAAALGAGLLAVVASIMVALPDAPYFGRLGIPPNTDASVSYGAGLLFAYAAVVLSIAAIWLAAAPAARDAQLDVGDLARSAGREPVGPAVQPVVASVPRQPWAAGTLEPLDLTVTPER